MTKSASYQIVVSKLPTPNYLLGFCLVGMASMRCFYCSDTLKKQFTTIGWKGQMALALVVGMFGFFGCILESGLIAALLGVGEAVFLTFVMIAWDYRTRSQTPADELSELPESSAEKGST